MTLGEKIKQSRLEKGLTQSALCGDFMTRNMLSRIENDSALPSLSTITYLSEKLGISAGYFIDNTASPLPYRKMTVINEIRQAYKARAYRKCIIACETLDGYDDETAFILADCHFRRGISAYESGRFSSAGKCFSEALAYAAKTMYPNDIGDRIAEYTNIMKNALTGGTKTDFPIETGEDSARRREFNMYLYMLRITETSRYDLSAQIYDTIKFSNPLYKKHISARLSAAAHNHNRAITLLGELIDDFDREKATYDFRLRVYFDLEASCKAVSDYEGAYNCVLMRNELQSTLAE